MTTYFFGTADELFIQGSSFVAALDAIELDKRFQELKGIFSGESLFFLRATGRGPVLINAFGSIFKRVLDGEVTVDTGHLVAFTDGLFHEAQKANKGWIASYFSGEGLVLRMRGRGVLCRQTRNPAEDGTQVGRRLPPKRE